MCGRFQRISWYSPSPWATTVGERAGPEPRSSLVDVSQWMMVALHVTVNQLEIYRCWDVVSRIRTGKGVVANILSIVHMVKQSQPFSCPFRANRIARLAMVGKMMAEAPSPDLPMKNSHAMTGSRRPGTLRKGRASAMQRIACRKPRIFTRRAPRMTKTKVKAKLIMMSYESSGIVMMSGRPMRHLPSTLESEVTGWMKAKTARTPKPKSTMAMPRR